MTRTVPLIAATALAVVPATAEAKTTITMSGSTSVTPLVSQLAKAYVKTPKAKGKVGFKVLQGGSDVGINDAARGRVTLGMASRDPLANDPGGLVFTKIARDGVCVVTHPSNPIGELSQAQVQAIFSGRTRSWGDIPGAKVTGTIDLVTRTASSGTADAFQSIFLGPNLRIAANASAKQSNSLVRQAVVSNRNAIGFVSFEFTGGVNAVGYKGVPCTLRNAKSGQYAGVRNFWLVSRGKATGWANRFLGWIKRDSKAKAIIASDWIPLR